MIGRWCSIKLFLFLVFLVIVITLLLFTRLDRQTSQSSSNLSSDYDDRNEEKMSSLSQISSMESLMKDYKSWHSIDAILFDQTICSRRFIITQQSCGNYGNNFGNFVLNAIMAVILNRTLLVDLSPRMWPCLDHWRPQAWVPYYQLDSIRELAAAKNCSLSSISLPISVKAGSYLKCCDLETSFQNERNFHFNGYFNSIAFSAYQPLSGAMLSDSARNRARILFSMQNFSFMRYASLGLVMSHILEFQPSVRDRVAPMLTNIENKDMSSMISSRFDSSGVHQFNPSHSLTVGLHIRHQVLGQENQWDASAIRCLTFAVNKYIKISGVKSCNIFLATDRRSTVDLIDQFGQKMGCLVQSVGRNDSSPVEATTEHGPWTDNLSKSADIYLLSQVDLFVGTAGSTFSSLIGNLVSWNGLRRRAVEDHNGRSPYDLPVILLVKAGKHADPRKPNQTCTADFDVFPDLHLSCSGKITNYNASTRSCS